ncbi:MAG: cytochrome c [Planifilum fimeticola]
MSKRWWKRVLVGGVLLWALTGCAGGTDQETQPPEQGETPAQEEEAPDAGDGATADAEVKAVYDNNCASCHGANLEGSFGPSLTNAGSKYSKEEIDEIIKNGKGQMPAQTQLSDAERASLSAWLAEQK